MMTADQGHMVITRHGRTVPLQRLNAATYYAALRTFGVSEAIAMALTSNLITVTKGK